jgi:RNA polymerase-binding transcription factor
VGCPVRSDRARTLIAAERERLEQLLAQSLVARSEVRSSEDAEIAVSDAAEPLTAEGVEDAVAAVLQARLDAVSRAELRLDAGTFGFSVASGEPIPDARLEADPTAELTVDEAAAGG